MSQVVQAACPGCKKALRIPRDWLHQALRCKHCGLVVQAKANASPARSAAPAPSPQPSAVTATPAAKVAPLAVPVAQPASAVAFADFDSDEDAPASRKARRQRKKGGGWKGPIFALAFLVLAGGGVYFFWDNLAALLPPDDDAVAENSKDKDPVAPPAAKKAAKNTPSSVDSSRTNNDKSTTKSSPSKTSQRPAPNDPPRPARPGSNLFPRRALVISIHDYLYANPILNGSSRSDNFHAFIQNLARVQIPLTQVAHLSDDSFPKDGTPRAPTKTVIEMTLTNFLNGSRAQDRIMVFFIGHSVELGDDVYLAPMEGELDRAATLIPLKWLYEQMAKCKARQKVLVLDINRYNPNIGQERPGGDEMGEKLDALLKAPPPGVQVWSSCVAKQRSYASDEYPMGIFLDSMRETAGRLGDGKIQNDPKKALPLERWVELVNQRMKTELGKRKLEQVSRLSGKEADGNDAYDPKEAPPPSPLAALANPPANVAGNKKLIESVLAEAGAPPIKVTHDLPMRYDALPPFPDDAIKKYLTDAPKADSPLRKAVKEARAVLWAIYPGQEPRDLSGEVSILRQRIGVQLNVLRDGYRAPTGDKAEKAFKDRVEDDERRVAKMMGSIDEALEKLRAKNVVEARESECKRWQANYDFLLARVQLEYAYLFEYQSALGSMRKEFPPRNAELQSGWKLASKSKLEGDREGQKAAKAAHALLDKIIKNNPGSPWEVLAKREKLTNLGLEWQATR
jgi:hypothetical protein